MNTVSDFICRVEEMEKDINAAAVTLYTPSTSHLSRLTAGVHQTGRGCAKRTSGRLLPCSKVQGLTRCTVSRAVWILCSQQIRNSIAAGCNQRKPKLGFKRSRQGSCGTCTFLWSTCSLFSSLLGRGEGTIPQISFEVLEVLYLCHFQTMPGHDMQRFQRRCRDGPQKWTLQVTLEIGCCMWID